METKVNNELTKPLYAIVDLGSNSFHLLIVRLVDDKLIVVEKIKRKVRLAAGLDESNNLNSDAIARGLDCLTLFTKHLAQVSIEHMSIVATATLRIATNRNTFLDAANKILPIPINLLSGEQEAETIFLGATCQQHNNGKQLVLDIGGASTEIIIGENSKAKKVISLNLGCVSFRKKYFLDDKLTTNSFTLAINAAKYIIKPIVKTYRELGWQQVVGSSGTMQALAEILHYRNLPIMITRPFLEDVKQSLISCQHIDNVSEHDDLNGLRADRIPVLASGLAILIALFDSLGIDNLQLSAGALREGLLHKLLMQNKIQMCPI
jgi:exopolyphosphatase/guanosine-5'-triphosphate,3'-diphosphate pyrophosphatase